MRAHVALLVSVLCLGGCASAPSGIDDVPIILNEEPFPDHGAGNPYTVEEIGKANDYIVDRLSFYKVDHLLTVYLVPTGRSNCLVFVPTRFGYEPSDVLLGKIAKDVEKLLGLFIRERPWNKTTGSK